MSLNDFSTDPASRDIATTEYMPGVWDYAALLSGGESLSSPTVTVTDVRTGSAVAAALQGSAAVAGNTVTQTIKGSALTPGRQYRVLVTATITPTQKVLALETLLNCLF